jgi:hypothetical protein
VVAGDINTRAKQDRQAVPMSSLSYLFSVVYDLSKYRDIYSLKSLKTFYRDGVVDSGIDVVLSLVPEVDTFGGVRRGLPADEALKIGIPQ